jgi:hypothetical protein
MLEDNAKMTELVSVDIDLPPIPRWQWMAIMMPDCADGLARMYGPKNKKERDALLKALRGEK